MIRNTMLAIVIATNMLTACAAEKVDAKPPAGAQPTAGKITRRSYGNVTLHTYVSPDDSFLDNTQIVETPTALVVFDGNFFVRYTAEVADYVQSLRKPIERIVLSHPHPDHFSGLTLLHERFPDAPIYAFPEVTAFVKAEGQAILDARNKAFNGAVAKTVTVPTHVLTEGITQIGGVPFVFEKVLNGESEYQTVVKMPEQHVLMGFDLVYARNTHMFTVADHFESWIRILEGFKALRDRGYDTIVPGHGPITDFDALDGNITYLRSAIAAHEASRTAAEYAKRLKDAYPSYYTGQWVDFSSLVLYGIIKA